MDNGHERWCIFVLLCFCKGLQGKVGDMIFRRPGLAACLMEFFYDFSSSSSCTSMQSLALWYI
jgi:hypothetical protein